MKKQSILEIKNLKKSFSHKGNTIMAADDISFSIATGETFGLVGESGSGKTTVARSIMRFFRPDYGSIFFDGKDILNSARSEQKFFSQQIQYIFQNPYSSLNPTMRALDIVTEPINIHFRLSRTEKYQRAEKLFTLVGLPLKDLHRFPHEFSGGQRQRIGIARSLALNPRLIICDEPLSALDVSIQGQIVNLLKKFQDTLGITYLFISHDLTVVKYLASKIGVMYLGHLVEIAPTDRLYAHPLHPYTQSLLSAILPPFPPVGGKKRVVAQVTPLPQPRASEKGCLFCDRCPKAMQICKEKAPRLKTFSKDHKVACHLYTL